MLASEVSCVSDSLKLKEGSGVGLVELNSTEVSGMILSLDYPIQTVR